MATPEVKVRLTAEGLADVVSAFQRISTAGQLAGAKTKGAFLPVGGTLTTIAGIAAVVGTAIATIGFARMSEEIRDTAEQTQLLSIRWATSVTDLTALDVALRRNGTSLFEQSRALTTFFNKTQQAAELGGESANQLRALGLSSAEVGGLASKDLAERLETVAAAWAKMPEGPMRTARALALVSVGGGNLLPILEQIGVDGFDSLYTRARKLGLLLDTDTVNAIGNLKDVQEDLALQSRGLATQFLAGFAGPMVSAFAAVSEELGSSSGFWREFGTLVGETLGGLLVLAVKLADAFGTMFQTLGKSLVYLGKASKAFLTNDQESLTLYVESIGLVWANEREALLNRFIVADAKFADKLAASRDPRNRGKGDQENDFDRLATERRAVREAALDADLKIAGAAVKRLEAQQDAAYEAGLLSTQEYYRRRRELALVGIDREIAAVEARKGAASGSEDGLKLQGTLTKLDGEGRKLLIDRAALLEDLARRESAEVLKVAQARLAAEEKVASTASEQHAIRLEQIDEEVAKLGVLLGQEGVVGEELDALLARARGVKTAVADFELAAAGANTALADFGRERDAIQSRIDAGLLSEVSGNEQLLDLSRSRLDALAEFGAEALRVAALTNDPGRVEEAERLLDSINAISLSVQAQEDSWLRLRAAAEDALVDGLGDFLANGARDAESFGAAMKQMASSVVESLRRVLAQMLALKIVSGLLGAFGGGSGDSDLAFSMQGPGFSTGGRVFGPGGPTADDIPARLSAGEFVVRAAAVARPGVLADLEAINRGIRAPLAGVSAWRGVARFAEGGLVGAGLEATASRVEIGGEVRVGLEDGLVGRVVGSPAGQRAVVRAVVENRRTLRRALG